MATMSEVVAVYLLIPLFISSVYGMNIPLPLTNNRYAFVYFVLVCTTWFAFVTYNFAKNGLPESS